MAAVLTTLPSDVVNYILTFLDDTRVLRKRLRRLQEKIDEMDSLLEEDDMYWKCQCDKWHILDGVTFCVECDGGMCNDCRSTRDEDVCAMCMERTGRE